MAAPNPALMARVAARFAALSDVARLRLLDCLRRGERSVGDLAAATGLAQPSVSKHLAVLRAVGLVAVRRHGTHSLYAPRDHSVYELCDLVCGAVARQHAEDAAALGIAKPARRSRH